MNCRDLAAVNSAVSLPHSDEPSPRSSSPLVVRARRGVSSTPAAPKAPLWITAIGLLGVAGFVLARLTLPARDAADECLHATLAEQSYDAVDLSLDTEIVVSGKLDVGGKQATEIANGVLSDPIRRRAIEGCRARYARDMRLGTVSPSLEVETAVVRIRVERTLERGSAEKLEVQAPVPGAEVNVENLPGPVSCVTSLSGDCELTLQHLPHDAKLSVAAKLANGAVVSRSTTLIDLLQSGLTLEALERAPVITLSVVSCKDRSPLSGVLLKAEAAGSRLWSTECGPLLPAQPDRCREVMGRHGDASFHYDKRPEMVTVTIIPPGEQGRETRVVALGATNVIELMIDGPCQARQPAPAVDCREARRSIESHAQLTGLPAAVAGHQLDVLVEVMSSGLVSDIQPVGESDPGALAALRSQLAGLRGLPGPCRDLPVSLRY